MRPGVLLQHMSTSALRLAHAELSSALREMQQGRLPQRDRLAEALETHADRLFNLLRTPVAFPPEIETMMVALLVRVTESGSYRDTLAAMTDAELSYTVSQLTRLRQMLVRRLEPDGDSR